MQAEAAGGDAGGSGRVVLDIFRVDPVAEALHTPPGTSAGGDPAGERGARQAGQ